MQFLTWKAIGSPSVIQSYEGSRNRAFGIELFLIRELCVPTIAFASASQCRGCPRPLGDPGESYSDVILRPRDPPPLPAPTRGAGALTPACGPNSTGVQKTLGQAGHDDLSVRIVMVNGPDRRWRAAPIEGKRPRTASCRRLSRPPSTGLAQWQGDSRSAGNVRNRVSALTNRIPESEQGVRLWTQGGVIGRRPAMPGGCESASNLGLGSRRRMAKRRGERLGQGIWRAQG